jgi:predicted dehydrogenase
MAIGIIGTGWGTRVQVPAFRAAGFNAVALAARNREKTIQQAQKLEIDFATDDWRKLLARDDVRFVSIVTPPNTHKEMAIAALQAGKHVLCEKPMALNTSETQAMVEAAQAHGGQYAIIDHELRFLPSFQLARQRVQRGDLGALRHVEVSVTTTSRADLNRPWNWWSDAEQGGGVLGALGSHQIDTLQFLFGPIAAVSGLLNTFIAERPSDRERRPVTADDYAAFLVRLKSGGLGTVSLSVVAGVDEPNRLTAHCEHGALRLQAGRILIAKRGDTFEDVTPPDSVNVPSSLRDGEFQHGSVYLGHALKRALTGDCGALASAATFTDGHHVQQVLDAVRQSNQENGRWIDIWD